MIDNGPPISCILDGKPYGGELPKGFKYIGMEVSPNSVPRYGKLYHPWWNLPCYVSPGTEPNG